MLELTGVILKIAFVVGGLILAGAIIVFALMLVSTLIYNRFYENKRGEFENDEE